MARKKRQMTRQEAVRRLCEEGEINTAMLAPLGISFESFLQYAQMPTEAAEVMRGKLVAHYRHELVTGVVATKLMCDEKVGV